MTFLHLLNKLLKSTLYYFDNKIIMEYMFRQHFIILKLPFFFNIIKMLACEIPQSTKYRKGTEINFMNFKLKKCQNINPKVYATIRIVLSSLESFALFIQGMNVKLKESTQAN